MVEYKVGQKFKVTNTEQMFMLEIGETVKVIEVDTADSLLPLLVSNGRRDEWVGSKNLSPLTNLSFADLVGGIADGSIKHGEKFEQIGGAHFELEVLNGNLVCSVGKRTILTTRETLEAEYVLVEAKKAEPKFKYVMDKELFEVISNGENELAEDVAEPTLNVSPHNSKNFEVSMYVGNWKTEFTNEEFDSLKLPYKFVKLLDKVEVK